MDDEEILQYADLTGTEAKALGALLRMGPMHPSALAKEAGLFRPQVYDALERLRHKNLVSYISRNNKRVYSVTEPDQIVRILEKKKKSIEDAIPRIIGTYSSAAKENVTVLEGVAGLKIMLNTVMEELSKNPQKNIYNVMLSDSTPVTLLGGWLRRWHKTRARRGLKARLIFTADAAWRGKQLATHAATKIRYIKKGQEIPLGLHSCGDYSWVIFWGKESPLSIQIKDNKIARAFDEYSELLWDAAESAPPKSQK